MAISRKLTHFRYIYRSLHYHQHTRRTLHHHQHTRLFHASPQPLFFRQDRYMCTGAAAAQTGTGSNDYITKDMVIYTAQTGSNDSNESNQSTKPKFSRGPVLWLSFLLLTLTGAGIVVYEKKKQGNNETSNAGQEAIGGPFNLVNHDGKSVTEKDFLGKWTIVYFGFTRCPDICPDELQKLAAAIDKIKKKAGLEIVPLFISVDPERDNVEQVREYVKEFHPNLIGLTGSPDEVKKAARAYRVYYMKTDEEDSDYFVEHSIIMYLMDPNMQFVKLYGMNHDVDSLTDGVIQEIKQYKKV